MNYFLFLYIVKTAVEEIKRGLIAYDRPADEVVVSLDEEA